MDSQWERRALLETVLLQKLYQQVQKSTLPIRRSSPPRLGQRLFLQAGLLRALQICENVNIAKDDDEIEKSCQITAKLS